MGAIASGVFTCGHPKSVSAALRLDPFGHRAGEGSGPFRPLGGQPAARLAGRKDPVRPTGSRPGRLEGRRVAVADVGVGNGRSLTVPPRSSPPWRRPHGLAPAPRPTA